MKNVNVKRLRVNKWMLIIGFTVVAFSMSQLMLDTNVHAKTSPFSFGQAETSTSFADLIEEVNPAVVYITVEKGSLQKMSERMPFNFDNRPLEKFFKRYFDEYKSDQLPHYDYGGVGSGFIINSDGYIVTNNHVIDDAKEITVTLHDGEKYLAEVIGVDTKTDIALLKIEESDLPYLEFADSDESRVGDWVVAIGNPFGFGGTATVGIISARGRDLQAGPYDDYLQIDAPINKGSSGGPVFNHDGEVVGVNTAIYSPNGGNVGIGFAIPSNLVQEIVVDLKEHGEVKRAWLGVQIQEITPEIAESLELEEAKGALVASVIPESPAEKAGIEVGDIIVKLNQQDIDNPKILSNVVASSDRDKKVKIKVWRDAEFKTIRVKLSKQEQNKIARHDTNDEETKLGLTITPLSDEMRDRYGYDDEVEGVLITNVQPGSNAYKEGFRPGDVILQLNKVEVTSPEDVIKEVKELRDKDANSVLILVRRDDAQRYVALSLA